MRLKRITIGHYKAIGQLDIRLPADLLFLIGSNGAGKSTVLQALSLVRHFAAGTTAGFFKERGWKSTDGRPRTASVSSPRPATASGVRSVPRRHLTVSLALEDDGADLLWTFRWNYGTERTVAEAVWVLGAGERLARRLFHVPAEGDELADSLPDLRQLGQLFLPGSILSLIRPEAVAATPADRARLVALRAWADGITPLELLNPVRMRDRLRVGGDDIGPQGERLTSFLAALDSAAKDRVVRRMSAFYPIRDLDTTRKRAGWIDMRVAEAFSLIGRIDVAHMSDGFLRILALCSIPELDEASLVLLDEVEDGIEPHILPGLIERIAAEAPAQLIVTSHSPLLINFFESEDVFLLARNRTGQTVGRSAAALTPFRQGEEYLGSGEIWANASITAINDELRAARSPRLTVADQPTARDVARYLRDGH